MSEDTKKKTKEQLAEEARAKRAAEKRKKAKEVNDQQQKEEERIAKLALANKGQEMPPAPPKKPDFPFPTKKVKLETDAELRKAELEDKVLVGWDPDTRIGTIKV